MNGLQKNTELGNNMKVEIDADTADGIVRASIKETIEYLREDIAILKKKKKLEDYQKLELGELMVFLNAMEIVFDYYGGNLK
jgi:hypothetical protein